MKQITENAVWRQCQRYLGTLLFVKKNISHNGRVNAIILILFLKYFPIIWKQELLDFIWYDPLKAIQLLIRVLMTGQHLLDGLHASIACWLMLWAHRHVAVEFKSHYSEEKNRCQPCELDCISSSHSTPRADLQAEDVDFTFAFLSCSSN